MPRSGGGLSRLMNCLCGSPPRNASVDIEEDRSFADSFAHVSSEADPTEEISGLLLYWRFAEKSLRRLISTSGQYRYVIQTKNWASRGKWAFVILEDSDSSPVSAKVLLDRRWNMEPKDSIENTDSWGEAAPPHGSLLVGNDGHVMINVQEDIDAEKAMQNWTLEFWVNPKVLALTTIAVLELGLENISIAVVQNPVRLKVDHKESGYQSCTESGLAWEPGKWIFLSLVFADARYTLFTVAQDSNLSRICKFEMHPVNPHSCPKKINTDVLKVKVKFGGSKKNPLFEITEVRFFDRSRQEAQILAEAFTTLSEATALHANLFKDVQIAKQVQSSPSTKTFQIPILPPPSISAHQLSRPLPQSSTSSRSLDTLDCATEPSKYKELSLRETRNLRRHQGFLEDDIKKDDIREDDIRKDDIREDDIRKDDIREEDIKKDGIKKDDISEVDRIDNNKKDVKEVDTEANDIRGNNRMTMFREIARDEETAEDNSDSSLKESFGSKNEFVISIFDEESFVNLGRDLLPPRNLLEQMNMSKAMMDPFELLIHVNTTLLSVQRAIEQANIRQVRASVCIKYLQAVRLSSTLLNLSAPPIMSYGIFQSIETQLRFIRQKEIHQNFESVKSLISLEPYSSRFSLYREFQLLFISSPNAPWFSSKDPLSQAANIGTLIQLHIAANSRLLLCLRLILTALAEVQALEPFNSDQMDINFIWDSSRWSSLSQFSREVGNLEIQATVFKRWQRFINILIILKVAAEFPFPGEIPSLEEGLIEAVGDAVSYGKYITELRKSFNSGSFCFVSEMPMKPESIPVGCPICCATYNRQSLITPALQRRSQSPDEVRCLYCAIGTCNLAIKESCLNFN